MQNISSTDYAHLKELLVVAVNRYSRNPTTYHSNLLQRALDIVAEHISDDAEPVESERRFPIF